jgi:callose synthase
LLCSLSFSLQLQRSQTALPTSVRFLQGLLALGIIAGIVLLIVLTSFTIADLFASALAFIAIGWCVLCVSTTIFLFHFSL